MKQKKMQEKKIVLIKEIIVSIVVVIAMTSGVAGLTYILNRPSSEIIRNSISFIWGCFMVVFLWYQSKLHCNLEYDNALHPLRFMVVFFLCFILSMGMVFAPTSSWFFLAIMVVLAMFSNTITGLTAGSVLLLITTSLSNSGTMYIFFLYFMIGLIGVSMFRNLGLDFQVTAPLLLSGMGAFVLQTAYIIIFENQPFTLEILFMPLLNLFINMILLFLILKYFSNLSMYLLQDKYSDINDQEFPIMAELKKKNKEQYFEAIHTAYLGERIARKLEINYKAVKGCCYYYKIASQKIASDKKGMIPITEFYEFPEDLVALIEECRNDCYHSKEACVVLTSNKIIRNIIKEQKKFQQEDIPYEDIISEIFREMLQSDALDYCDISIKELNIMARTFIEEKLYYDFLR